MATLARSRLCEVYNDFGGRKAGSDATIRKETSLTGVRHDEDSPIPFYRARSRDDQYCGPACRRNAGSRRDKTQDGLELEIPGSTGLVLPCRRSWLLQSRRP